MKRDPGPTNLQFFGFARGPKPEVMTFLPELTEMQIIKGRPGAAERDVVVRYTAENVTPFRMEIETEGWYPSKIELNDHQVKRLLEKLVEMSLL